MIRAEVGHPTNDKYTNARTMEHTYCNLWHARKAICFIHSYTTTHKLVYSGYSDIPTAFSIQNFWDWIILISLMKFTIKWTFGGLLMHFWLTPAIRPNTKNSLLNLVFELYFIKLYDQYDRSKDHPYVVATLFFYFLITATFCYAIKVDIYCTSTYWLQF